jgi:transposase
LRDLEQHRRLDVLPDRDAARVAAWLQRYPSIEFVSRDRSDIYATAAKMGDPQAIQVADKWHLLKNLSEFVQRLLAHRLAAHQKHQQEKSGNQRTSLLHKRLPHLTKQQEHIVQIHRDIRESRYQQVLALRRQGLSHQAIASQGGKATSLTPCHMMRRSGVCSRMRQKTSRWKMKPSISGSVLTAFDGTMARKETERNTRYG